MTEPIVVTYTSIDRCYVRRQFRTLAGARAFAEKYVGPTPEMGRTYAVSGDGIGKIVVRGATLQELFPASGD